MIKKTLICLNEDSKFLENYFKNDFFEGNSEIACEFIYDKAAFDGKKQAIECNAYDAIVVLCELTWEGHTSAQLWGIELVQQEFCLNPHILPQCCLFPFSPKPRYYSESHIRRLSQPMR